MTLYSRALEAGDLSYGLQQIVQIHLVSSGPGSGEGPRVHRAEGAVQIAAAARPDLKEVGSTIDDSEIQAAHQGYAGGLSDADEVHAMGIKRNLGY